MRSNYAQKFLSFIFVLLIVGVAYFTQSEDPQETAQVQMQKEVMEKQELPEFINSSKESELIAYNQLDETEKEVYDTLLWGMANHETLIYLEHGIDADILEKCYRSIDIDHPKLFWLSTGYVTWEDRISGEITSVEPEYYFTEEEVTEYQQKIIAEKEKILQGISDTASDYEKVKYVYETLIFNTRYVDAAEYNQSLYSILINHETVCTGYAKAVQYLLHEIQIPCAYVYGMADDGETVGTHAWNIVGIDENFYYVDATWGDSGESDDPEYISYDYLCQDQAYMEATHTMDIPVEMPQCLDDSLDYYMLNNMWCASYDEEMIKTKIAEELEVGEPLTFVFERAEDYQAMFEDLENGNINNWISEEKGLNESRIEYWYDDGSRHIELSWVEGLSVNRQF